MSRASSRIEYNNLSFKIGNGVLGLPPYDAASLVACWIVGAKRLQEV